MKWRTHIEDISLPFNIDHDSNLLFMGSCFATNIGLKFKQLKFLSLINPTGISYNPYSLLKQIKMATSNSKVDANSLLKQESDFVHLDFHSKLSHHDRESCAANINASLASLNTYLKSATVVFISLGSTIAFKWKDNGNIVANCHRLPLQHFEKYIFSQQETNDYIHELVKIIQAINAQTAIVFTVSPVRHARHGLIQDNRSKSSLLSAVHETCDQFTTVSYFPSYEIMKDDLRDYRFYKEDLVHPSATAIQYIWEKLTAGIMTPNTQSMSASVESLVKQTEHQVMSSNAEEQRKYYNQLLKKINAHPMSHRFESEISAINHKMSSLTDSDKLSG